MVSEREQFNPEEGPELRKKFKKDLAKAEREATDALPDEKMQTKAENILHYLGLTLEDLRGKTVLDSGSNLAFIERGAMHAGIDTQVISLERGRLRTSRRRELRGRLRGDSTSIPLEDSSIDLVISSSAPPTIPGGVGGDEKNLELHKEHALKTLKEFLRVVTDDGEIRISPPWMYFIAAAHPLFPRWKSLVQERRQSENQAEYKKLQAEILEISKQISELSTRYLEEMGLDIQIVDDKYWVIKKLKNENSAVHAEQKGRVDSTKAESAEQFNPEGQEASLNLIDTFGSEMEVRWKNEGQVYRRKIEPIKNAEQVSQPQDVETILPDGTIESVNRANPGDWIITGSKGEKFVFTSDKFNSLYNSDGQGGYVPKERRIVALQNPFSEPISIVAPWSTPNKKEYQHGNEDCMLVASLDENGDLTSDRYIIGNAEMLLNNYEPVENED